MNNNNFPALKTMGFYLDDPNNLEFLQVLNPNIHTVILYIPDDSTPPSIVDSSRTIIFRPISQSLFGNSSHDYIYPETYLDIWNKRHNIDVQDSD